jgi:Ca2+-binding RTX toxin-like protein
MSGSVTVPGTGGSTISGSFNNSSNLALAQQIANALAAASKSGSLNITTASGGVSPTPPSATGTNELIITGGGDYTIPAGPGSGGVSDYIVILDTPAAVTIHGAPATTIWGGSGPTTIIDPNLITIDEGAGDALVNLTALDNNAIVAGNDKNDTLTAAGTNDTIQGGAGNNVLSVSGTNDLIVSGTGLNTIGIGVGGTADTVDAQAGPAVATLAGGAGLFLAGIGTYQIADQGIADTIQAGPGAVSVSASGSVGVIRGSIGPLSVLDSGTADTVWAGTGPSTVTASGIAGVVFGGAGHLTLTTSGTGETLFGGAGDTTIFGGGDEGTYLLGAGVNVYRNEGGDKGRVFAGPTSTTVYGSFGANPGSDQVFGGSGDLTVVTAGSNETVFGGSDNTTVYGAFGGTVGDDVIFGGSGILEVATGNSNDTVYGGTSAGQTVFGGFDSVAANNGNSVIFSGANAMVIDPAGSSDTIYAGSGNDTLWFGTGSIAGNNVVFGGSGNIRGQFVGGAGSVSIIGGTGSDTLYGNANSDMNYFGTQSGVTMIALGPRGAGLGETLNAGASSTNNFLNAFSGSDSVVGGSGDDTLVGGVTDTGATTMTGGAGNNLFFFRNGDINGTDIVTDLTASSGNQVVLANYDSMFGGAPNSAAQAALAGATTVGGNTTITLADGTKITFDNTSVAQLQQHLFST